MRPGAELWRWQFAKVDTAALGWRSVSGISEAVWELRRSKPLGSMNARLFWVDAFPRWPGFHSKPASAN